MDILLCSLSVVANDGLKMKLCHAPIAPQDVTSTFSKNRQMDDGNFLIRESRNTNSAYTLSLFFQGSIMNYRIIYDENEGYSFQDPDNMGEDGSERISHNKHITMMDLIAHHRQAQVCDLYVVM